MCVLLHTSGYLFIFTGMGHLLNIARFPKNLPQRVECRETPTKIDFPENLADCLCLCRRTRTKSLQAGRMCLRFPQLMYYSGTEPVKKPHRTHESAKKFEAEQVAMSAGLAEGALSEKQVFRV